ncbi:MAG: endonuclease III [Candidatus Spechtbacteria bacterium RIFCSPHIGHO2_02_FULL_43_15b]|nr:MAG: endonuclease III [Candidatus Spechtbacteria bacterium RIFCSPHIGHO2_02_FULL_43_15b]
MESFSEKKNRAQKIYNRLNKAYPNAKIVLNYENDIQLLVAVILSAQCTDKKVNEITEKLFKKYKTADDFAKAELKIFENEIRSAGFYHNKAKNIIASTKIIRDKFGEKLPGSMEEMLSLPGVARKTANVVLGNAYGIFEGIAVDTHVKRVSRHLGLTDEENPVKIEEDLMRLFDKRKWFRLTYLFIEYGRNAHTAKRSVPCGNGPLKGLCPKD